MASRTSWSFSQSTPDNWRKRQLTPTGVERSVPQRTPPPPRGDGPYRHGGEGGGSDGYRVHSKQALGYGTDFREQKRMRILFHAGDRAIGAGQGEELKEDNQARIFNNMINKTLKMSAQEGLDQLCKLMSVEKVKIGRVVTEIDNLANMNVIHLSTAVDTLGKILEKGVSERVPATLERTINALADGVAKRLEPGFGFFGDNFGDNPRALASVMHGLALIHASGHSNITSNKPFRDSLMRHIHNISVPESSLRPWDITQVLWGFAKLGWFQTKDDLSVEVLHKIDRLCCKSLDSSLGAVPARFNSKFDGVDLCNVLQALAMIENACGLTVSNELLGKLEVCAGNEAHTLEFAQGVVTTVTGLAKLERDPPNFVKARLCIQAIHCMKNANGQDISNLMWGMAKMGWHPPPELLDLLYSRMRDTAQMFNRQEIVNMFWATAMMSVRLGPGDEYWEKMTGRIQQDMSMVFHALSLMGHAPPAMLDSLLKRLPPVFQLHDCTPQNVTLTFRALAVLQVDVPDQVLHAVEDKCLSLIRDFNGQDISGLYWSFATLKKRPSVQLMECMAKRVVRIQQDLNPQDVSLIAWSVTTGSWHLSESEKEQEEDLLLNGGVWLRRSAAVICEYSKAYDPTPVMGALEERIYAIKDKLMPRDFANVFWAVTRLGAGFSNFFMTLCEGLESSVSDWQLKDMDPRDIAQIVQALSMNHTCLDENIVDREGRTRLRNLLDILANMCLNLIHKFNAADISDVLKAVVHLDWTPKMQNEVMTKLLERSVHVTDTLDGRCLSELVWAVARIGRELDHTLVHIVSERAKDLLDMARLTPDTFKPIDIATFMWGMAKLRIQPDTALSMRLHQVVSAHVEHYKPTHLAQILWSLASVPAKASPENSSERQAHVEFRNRVLRRIKELAQDCRTADVTTILWSLVVMSDDEQLFSHEVFRDDFREVVGEFALRVEAVFEDMKKEGAGEETRAMSPRSPRSRVQGTFDRSDMCMLHQFFISCEYDRRLSEAVGASDCSMHRVRQKYKVRCRNAFEETRSAASDTQNRVSEVLKKHMNFDVESETRCKDSGYSIDMRVTCRATQEVWLVEVNGPSHYFAGENPGKLGATRLKERHFALLGHHLVTVPYWEWDKLYDSSGYREHEGPSRLARTRDQVDYLQKLLRPQVDASISLDVSATNLSLEANELSKADTPVKEPAEADASKLLAGEDLQDGTGSLLAGL